MDFKNIQKKIEQLKPMMIELQTILTACPAIAPESGGDGEWEKAELLIRFLQKCGFTNFTHYDAPDKRVSKGLRPNFSVLLEGESAERTIWIMSHLDVVPAGELSTWKTDPFTLTQKGDKLFGRGTEDNQQGLVSSVAAACAFLQLGIKSAYNVRLLFVADEEVGSKYGIDAVLKHKNVFSKNDIIFVPDAGDPKGSTIEIAEKTGLTVKVHTVGLQTHASMPESGANAFLAACDFALSVDGLHKVFDKQDNLFSPNYSTFAPTKKLENVPNTNTIPGDDVFYIDCRILPCYTTKEVFSYMKKCASEIEKKHNVKIELEAELRDASPTVSPDAPAVKVLQKAITDVKKIEPKLVGIGGGTVAAHLRKAGYDAVVWSTLDDCAHQSNEYCSVKNMLTDALVFAHIMYNTTSE